MPLLRLVAISKRYEKTDRVVTALEDASLTVEPGEFVTIWGPSGAGKSTLLNIIGTLERPTAGEYHFSDRLVSSLSDKELARFRANSIGFIFQSYNLLPYLRAWQNVALPNRYSRRLSPEEAHERAKTLLEMVGLSDRIEHFPTEMSGGEEQRVALARALMNEPALLLADEPTGNLDSVNHRQVIDVLKRVNAAGTTVLVVSHNPDFTSIADRCVRISDGKLVAV